MDRYDGFASFVKARAAVLSRTAYLLAGDHDHASALLSKALASVARRWPRVRADGDPEAAVRAALARAAAAGPARHNPLRLTAREWVVTVLSERYGYSAAEVSIALDRSEISVRSDRRAVPPGVLDDLARRAGEYGDPNAAIAAARRARRRSLLVPVVLAVGLAAASGTVVASRGHRSSLPLPQPAPAASSTLTLPPQVTQPQTQVPYLPADRAVGPAVIAYRACPRSCPAYLLMADGTQYQLQLPSLAAGCCDSWSPATRDLPVSLSPDGRWLAVSDGLSLRIRDLSGTDVRTAQLADVVAWSPDDRYLLGDCPSGRCRADLDSSALAAMDPRAAGVDRTGRVSAAFASLVPTTVDIQMTDPDASAAISGGKILGGSEALWLPTDSNDPSSPSGHVDVAFGSGSWYAATVYDMSSRRPKALLIGNDADGSIALRANLPDGAGPPFFFSGQATIAVQPAPTDPIKLLGVAPGGLVELSTLRPRAEYAVAGQGLAAAGPAATTAPP